MSIIDKVWLRKCAKSWESVLRVEKGLESVKFAKSWDRIRKCACKQKQ